MVEVLRFLGFEVLGVRCATLHETRGLAFQGAGSGGASGEILLPTP